jgi:uroporphyrin-III C-methyltransferase
LTVARIKGGDPSIFGRGGEEIECLQKNGIAYEVIAGVTAASGICAALGISLTHRDSAHSLIYLAGPHFEPPAETLCLPSLQGFGGTIVVYMGLKSCEIAAKELILRGLPPGTPSVAVQSGTLADQKCAFAPISELPQRVKQAELESPVLLIIGQVVALSPQYRRSTQLATGVV